MEATEVKIGSCRKLRLAHAHGMFVMSCRLNSESCRIAAAASEESKGSCKNPMRAKDHAVLEISCGVKLLMKSVDYNERALTSACAPKTNMAYYHRVFDKFCGSNSQIR